VARRRVASFVRGVLRRLLPRGLLGSPANERALFRGVGVFLRLRRFERLAVRQAARGFKLSHCAWLTAHTRGHAAGPDAGAARRVRGEEAAAMQRRAMRVVAFIYTVSCRAPFLLSPLPLTLLSPHQQYTIYFDHSGGR
jgi:hypothetical protein